jgi:hypothetical protein
MKKTILLTQHGLLGSNISRWVITICGLLYSLIGIGNLIETPRIGWGSISMISIGLLQAIFGFILLDAKSMFAPKFIIDENEIRIREAIHKSTKSIIWSDIKEITYESFALDFLLNDGKNKVLNLQTNAETSIEIKKCIREIAEKKSINIIGG